MGTERRQEGLHTSKFVAAHGWPIVILVAAVRGSCTIGLGVVAPLRRSRSGSSLVVRVLPPAISKGIPKSA